MPDNKSSKNRPASRQVNTPKKNKKEVSQPTTNPADSLVGIWNTTAESQPITRKKFIKTETINPTRVSSETDMDLSDTKVSKPKAGKQAEMIEAYLKGIEDNSNPVERKRTKAKISTTKPTSSRTKVRNKKDKVKKSSKILQEDQVKSLIIDQVIVESLAAGAIITAVNGVKQVVNYGKYSVLGVKYVLGDTLDIGKSAINFVRPNTIKD